MLTKLRIRNFKQFEDVEIELGQSVVFIGPNNSGKTTALQALALWDIGLKQWLSKRGSLELSGSRPGVAINRLSLTPIPLPTVKQMWRGNLVSRSKKTLITIGITGRLDESEWACNLSFRYMNEESMNCTPDQSIPLAATQLDFAFLPAMSGLVLQEDRLLSGSIQRRIGEGSTADILRNLCYQIYEQDEQTGYWRNIVRILEEQFRCRLSTPILNANGTIELSYRNQFGNELELISSGRGMLQTLLLLAYMYNNPGAVLLLDEPDAHLEILRQREIYTLLKSVASEQGSQIIIATHSEVIMDNAAKDKDSIVAFVGQPHQLRKLSDLRKSLTLVPTSDYYLAERKRWILYLEDSTDFEILRAFATHLGHEARDFLELAFVKDIENNEPQIAKIHFTGLQEGTPDLIGIALFDRISEGKLTENVPPGLSLFAWRRKEIENYFILPEALIAYARQSGDDGEQRAQIMEELLRLLIPPIALNDLNNRWWVNTKASDDFLDQLFSLYSERLKLPLVLRKADYYRLVQFMPKDKIDPEITEKLDAIVEVARRAQSRKE